MGEDIQKELWDLKCSLEGGVHRCIYEGGRDVVSRVGAAQEERRTADRLMEEVVDHAVMLPLLLLSWSKIDGGRCHPFSSSQTEPHPATKQKRENGINFFRGANSTKAVFARYACQTFKAGEDRKKNLVLSLRVVSVQR